MVPRARSLLSVCLERFLLARVVSCEENPWSVGKSNQMGQKCVKQLYKRSDCKTIEKSIKNNIRNESTCSKACFIISSVRSYLDCHATLVKHCARAKY